MSDNEHQMICPNCDSPASDNFCAHCGQENHLHRETFWGLVMHFIGHYFHYDSKFWQTLKALWFSPGKLTIAYRENQRMRYIPPVSLYIFISAIYFLASFTFSGGTFSTDKTRQAKRTEAAIPAQLSNTINNDTTDHILVFNKNTDGLLSTKMNKLHNRYGDTDEFIMEKLNHSIPRLFFFMIPVMALMLKLLFLRNKNQLFVDHAIFSLHYHSFWFSIFLITQFNLPYNIAFWLKLILFIPAIVYMVVALRNVYNKSWLRSVIYMLILSTGYIFVLTVAFIIDLLLTVALA